MLKSKFTGKQKAFQQLRRVAPEITEELNKGMQKSAEEVAGLARDLAPKQSGDYAETIQAKPIEDEAGVPSWGVFASWIWRFIEFGTQAGKRGERVQQKGRSRKVGRTHPGTPARPHIWPAYRAFRKRIKGRTTRSINKAVKRAVSRR
ncbi:HK97 gp10 family phage protein [uncultured Cohaesibacter sp.]|uniref:HK97 gp10 family phage protein n=1 Tax=uncultured Cohaesibacter sp. TaxID=1002546 RepID=UPI0029C6D269|nr:HK97 gp10 family phage protein [uncultured Cohaesibacter sp.]